MLEVYARSPISPLLEFKSRGSKCRYTGQRVREPNLMYSRRSRRERCGQVYRESAHHIRKQSIVGPKDQENFLGTKAGRKESGTRVGAFKEEWNLLKHTHTHTHNPAQQ